MKLLVGGSCEAARSSSQVFAVLPQLLEPSLVRRFEVLSSLRPPDGVSESLLFTWPQDSG